MQCRYQLRSYYQIGPCASSISTIPRDQKRPEELPPKWHSTPHQLCARSYIAKIATLSNEPIQACRVAQESESLLKKAMIRENMSPCAVLFMLKQEGSTWICVDGQAINQIVVKYPFPIPWTTCWMCCMVLMYSKYQFEWLPSGMKITVAASVAAHSQNATQQRTSAI